jgi:hypothetical protein
VLCVVADFGGFGLELRVLADIVSDTCIIAQWIVLANNSGGACGFTFVLEQARTVSNLSVLLSDVVAANFSGEQAAA